MKKIRESGNSIVLDENKFEKFCRIAICILVMLFFGFVFLVSMLHTTGMEIVNAGEGLDTCVYTIKERIESVVYYNDSLIMNIVYLVLTAAACFIIVPRSKKIPVWSMILFICLWTIVLGTIWVYSSQTSPSEDSYRVFMASVSASQNDLSFLQDTYFKEYSYQLGYVLFNEILLRIHSIFAEYKTGLFVEVLNVLFLAGSYSGLIMINKRLFNDNRICAITTLIFALSLQPLLFSVFIYGIIPGFVFAVWAFYFEIRYLQTNKIYNAAISAILIDFAIIIKSNYLIFFIAMMMVLVIKMFGRKKFIQDIAYIVVAAVLVATASPSIKSFYESRGNVDLGDSVPYSSWIAMGLNETDLAPGWYNAVYTVFNFEDHNSDADEAGSASTEEIKNRLKYFIAHPQYTDDFFYKKTVSQWNETSYQSIWNNEVRIQYKDKGKLASYICGKGEKSTKRYMDIISQLIFASCLAGIVIAIRKKNIIILIMPITIFGGFLYHSMAEGKSQYIMPYFILMMAFTAFGICNIYDILQKKFEKNKITSKLFCVVPKTLETVAVTETPTVTESEINPENTESED